MGSEMMTRDQKIRSLERKVGNLQNEMEKLSSSLKRHRSEHNGQLALRVHGMMTVGQAASLLGMTENLLYRKIRNRSIDIHTHTFDGRMVLLLEDILKEVAKREVPSQPEEK